MNRPLTYSQLANLNEEYIFEKLKQGKSTEQLKMNMLLRIIY